MNNCLAEGLSRTQEGTREDARKGESPKLKGETQLQKDILANADKVEEEGATAKALRAGDKATAVVMKEHEQHDDDYHPDEDTKDDTSQCSTSSSNNSSTSGSSSSNGSKTNEQSTTTSSTTDEKKKKKKRNKKKKKKLKSKHTVAKGNKRQKRPAAFQGGRPKKR